MQRKERGWRGLGTLHEKRGSFRRSSVESTFCPGGCRGTLAPSLPAASPRALRGAKQANPCADTGAVPGRNGRAATAPCSHAPGRQAPAQPNPGATAGTPRCSLGHPHRSAAPSDPLPARRAGSAPRLGSGGPARPRALTHLDGLSLASRLPSTTAGTQLVSSVQSACSPQLQPVENLEKSQVSRLPGRWQVHVF